MAIRRTITQDIPFLKSYTPYTLPSGTVECFTVRDMFDYPTVPIAFDYYIGESSDTLEFNFKNLTNETTIEVNVNSFTSNALTSSKDNVSLLKLKPLQSQSLKFKIDSRYMDRIDIIKDISGSIDLTIKNIFNNTVSTKSGSVTSEPETTPIPTPSNTSASPTPTPSTTPSVTPSTTPSKSTSTTPTVYYCCFEDVTNPGTCASDCFSGNTPCNLVGPNAIQCSPIEVTTTNNSGGSIGSGGSGGSGGPGGDTFI